MTKKRENTLPCSPAFRLLFADHARNRETAQKTRRSAIPVLTALACRENSRQKKLTLDAAASCTGVSRSMLAQIEKGEVTPTISVLWKMANGYKVSFTSLTEDRGEAVSAVRQRDLQPLPEDGGRYLTYPIFAFDERKLFETYRVVIKTGGSLSARPHLKGAEEYITVFAGQVEITAAEERLALAKGDSVRFRADVPHAYRNSGPENAELSMIIYYGRA